MFLFCTSQLVFEQKAVVIQRCVRGWLARRRYNCTMAAVILLQSLVRRWKAKKDLRKLKVEARSVEHFKKLNVGMENKILQLQHKINEQVSLRPTSWTGQRQIRDCSLTSLELLWGEASGHWELSYHMHSMCVSTPPPPPCSTRKTESSVRGCTPWRRPCVQRERSRAVRSGTWSGRSRRPEPKQGGSPLCWSSSPSSSMSWRRPGGRRTTWRSRPRSTRRIRSG